MLLVFFLFAFLAFVVVKGFNSSGTRSRYCDKYSSEIQRMVSFMTIKAGTKVRLFCALRFTIGAILLWGVAYRSVLPCNPRPSFLSPFPKSVIFFDYILFDSIHFHAYAKCLAALVIPMAFALWSIPLLWGQTRIPIRAKY